MSNNDEPKNSSGQGSNFTRDKIRVEIPTERELTYQQRIPSGYDPMGEIYLRGRAMRNMSSGTIPWWVLISGWVLFGGSFLLLISTAIFSKSLALILYLIIPGIFVLIVLRGTLAKLQTRKRRRR
jgi:VIT1/CCC1 family predicted Fe2+/Mn2+ transporter